MQDLGYKTDYYIYLCDSRERDIWLGVVYGYKAVLQVGAIFLAFGTRKVTIKGLNDAQYIAAAIYVTSLFLTAIIVLSVTVNDYANLFPALIGGGILITTTSILGLVFVPKVCQKVRPVTLRDTCMMILFRKGLSGNV